MTERQHKCSTKEGSDQIHLVESTASWKNDIKFLGTQFLFETLLFMVGEAGDVELHAHDHEERHATMIAFEFPRGLTSSETMFSVAVGY
jgi:hypothetical protein